MTKKEEQKKRHLFFLEIWNERPHKSEISNVKLYDPISSVYFHHILNRKKYPEAEYDKDNIILVTLDEHTNVENDMYRYDEINKRREQLKTKYGID